MMRGSGAIGPNVGSGTELPANPDPTFPQSLARSGS